MKKWRLLVDVDESGRVLNDRMFLPESILHDLQGELEHIPSPLTFCIYRDKNDIDTRNVNMADPDDKNALTNDNISRIAFGVVREFTASEGKVVISAHTAHWANVCTGEEVWVEMRTLPKLTRAVAVPLSTRFLAVSDIRSLLEAHLRMNHAVLANGETLSVPVPGGDPVEFRIDALTADAQTVEAASVIDTDIELIIQPPPDMQQAIKDTSSQTISLTFDPQHESLHEVNLAETCYKYFTIRFNAPTALRLHVECLQGDVDVFVSRLFERPSIQDWTWRLVDSSAIKEMSLILTDEHPKHATTPADVLFVALYGYSSKNICRFTIGADKSSVKKETPTNGIALEEGKVTCPNCQALVPERTIEMHKAFCERNNIRCPKCEQVFKKDDFAQHWHCDICNKIGKLDERSKHDFYFHTPFQCSCSESLTLVDFSNHRTITCPRRLITCRFCHTIVYAGLPTSSLHDRVHDATMTSHESECGGRTVPCRQCNQFVRLKDVEIHMSLHRLTSSSRGDPIQVCRNRVCSDDQDVKNGMGLCRMCFGPLWSSELDEGNVKRTQKVLHMYFKQLTEGCGHAWCWNPQCKSNQEDGANDATEAALKALELTKNGDEFWFCVSRRTSHQMRKMAEGLKELGFSLAWCIKALRETRKKATSTIQNDDNDSSDEEEDEGALEAKWLEYAATYLTQNAPPLEPE